METFVLKLGQLSSYSKTIVNDDLLVDKTIFDHIKEILRTNESSKLHECLCPLLVFLLEHLPLEIDWNVLCSTDIDEIVPLSSTKSKRKSFLNEAEEILRFIFEKFKTKNLDEFIQIRLDSQTIFHHCFILLKPFLIKSENSLALEIFVQLVRSTRRNLLNEYLDEIFRLSLNVLDDSSIELKIFGLILIDHLQRHLTSSELSLYNRSAVIMLKNLRFVDLIESIFLFRFALEQNLYRRNDRLIFFECLLSTSFRWLKLIENPIYVGKHLFIRTSQLINRLIRDALLETNYDYRRLIIRILRFYLQRLEYFSLRHFSSLIDLINDTIIDEYFRRHTFELFQILLEQIHQRIDFHRDEIWKIFLRSSMKIVDEKKNLPEEFFRCLNIFRSIVGDDFIRQSLQSLIDTSNINLSYRNSWEKLFRFLFEK